ncbi:Helix-loop-helix protein 13 [Trichinella zimbabwensis]|uniref:Helix-loop-helix protein 13 n=1 Tax=Trichinella zimbabwensis TaxID=268475 RepID=A0A0V1H4E0_9BILA|nr:Helix-loop-helix protein 13 [Trichinella zimbabwensis]
MRMTSSGHTRVELDKSLLSTEPEIKPLAMQRNTYAMNFSEEEESSSYELYQEDNHNAVNEATIFVGNLNGCIMRADLANHFQQFGKIVSIVLPMNRPFYAFIQFSKVEEAKAALNHGLRQNVRACAYAASNQTISSYEENNIYSKPFTTETYNDFIHEVNLNNVCKTNEVQTSGWVSCDERNTANLRERKRMSNINMAFEKLRCCVPQFPFEKRLSKIDILWLAIAYMGFLDALLTVETNVDEFIRNLGLLHRAKRTSQPSWLTSDFLARISWVNWEKLGLKCPLLQEEH